VRPIAGGDSAYQHGGWKSFEAQTGPTGTVTGTRQYDAFGAQLASTGAWQGALAHGGGFGYQSDDTGLQLLGHRYYDPSTGRFLTRDPIKDGPNWYAYCLNDPVNWADPNGLDKIVIVRGEQGGPGEDADISGYTDTVIGWFKKDHPDDTIVVVDNLKDLERELVDADRLVFIGHSDSTHLYLEDGESITPYWIGDRRGVGNRLDRVDLVGCNTLSDASVAAAWGRTANGNVYGTYSGLPMNWYVWGLPFWKPVKYKEGSKTFWGGRKKGYGKRAGG
jgi:RHS repeat-associated protein